MPTTRNLIALAVTVAVTAFLAVLFVRPDHFSSLDTYGLSIGTDSAYCSADLVSWHPELTCERAG